MATDIRTGTVKWFNNTKGFGFIIDDHSGEDVFAHFQQIKQEGYRHLKAGQSVGFTLNQGDKGLNALDIQPQA